jgi:homoserine O-succinyltransferase/O-acetyltransferase
MPLIIDEGRTPPHWAAKLRPQHAELPSRGDDNVESIRLALINNMPDAALEDTEAQFFQLLDAAAGPIPVSLELYSLPKLPRSDRAQDHLRNYYFEFDDLWNKRFDGVIVTGTEPRQPNLRDEPYWPALVDVMDWAEHNTASTVLSCLAAHAGVLYSDGIERHRLNEKRFGVFAHKKVCEHPLTQGTEALIQTCHSRWNELPEDALTSCGYTVLTRSLEAGVDLFVKRKGRSLFVHFQGHPEYEAQTLLKEFRRDIKRYLKRERETYPAAPYNYLDASASNLLAEFRERVGSNRLEDLIAQFPDGVAGTLQNKWQLSAACIYRNWLRYLSSKSLTASDFPSAVAICGNNPRKRSVLP